MKDKKAPQLTEQEIKEIPLISIGVGGGSWRPLADYERDEARRMQSIEKWSVKKQLRKKKLQELKKWLFAKIGITAS